MPVHSRKYVRKYITIKTSMTTTIASPILYIMIHDIASPII